MPISKIQIMVRVCNKCRKAPKGRSVIRGLWMLECPCGRLAVGNNMNDLIERWNVMALHGVPLDD
jgi:hypothetical protein